MKLNVQAQGDERILDVDGQMVWGVLKIRQFSWTSYVYHPLYENSSLIYCLAIHLISCKLIRFCLENEVSRMNG